jgi:hypothetical protein
VRDYGVEGWKYSLNSINFASSNCASGSGDLLNDLLCDNEVRNI